MAISKQFEKVVKDLMAFRGKVGLMVENFDRPWMDFAALGMEGNFDFESLQDVFDITDAENDYAKSRQDGGLTKNMQTAKLSADWVAQFGRDFRYRKRSRIRRFVHAALRAQGDKEANGPLCLHSQGWMQRLLGGDAPETAYEDEE